MRSKEISHKTDKGAGLRRVVELSRPIVITPQMVETQADPVYLKLLKAFKRKFLYDWYSRNHKRYALCELFIEATLVTNDIPQDVMYWSQTHSAKETAGTFFTTAARQIADKITKRRYDHWTITAIGVAMWRAK